jgi:hypothetical protein
MVSLRTALRLVWHAASGSDTAFHIGMARLFFRIVSCALGFPLGFRSVNYYDCYVCSHPIAPDAEGMIRVEGVTELPRRAAWEWGPEPLHEECRPALVTPFDGMAGYKLTWQQVRAKQTALSMARSDSV